MKKLLIILLILAGCTKDKEPQPEPVKPTEQPPVAKKCETYQYGNDCQYEYIDSFLGNYTLIVDNEFRQHTAGGTLIRKLKDTFEVSLIRNQYERAKFISLWEGGQGSLYKNAGEDIIVRTLPRYKDIPPAIDYTNVRFVLKNDTFYLKKDVEQHINGVSVYYSTRYNMKMFKR